MAALVLRVLTRAGDTTKGSPLTMAEMDQNLINLDASIDLRAPLASPALTGTPHAPTPPTGTNTAQIATTGFVQAEIPAHFISYGLLANGSFERPLDGNWVAGAGIAGAGVSGGRTQAQVHTGAWSCHITASAVGTNLNRRFFQTLPIVGGGTYRLSGATRTSVIGVNVRMFLEYFNTAGAPVGAHEVLNINTTTTDWFLTSGVFTVPAAAVRANVLFDAMDIGQGVAGTAWFDSIELVREHVTPVSLGGTGATDAAAARTAIGAHDASNLTTGNVAADRIRVALNSNNAPPMFACRAWWDHDANGFLRAAGGVTSVTRFSIGDYQANLSHHMPFPGYATFLHASTFDSVDQTQQPIVWHRTSNSVRYLVRSHIPHSPNTIVDRPLVVGAIFT